MLGIWISCALVVVLYLALSPRFNYSLYRPYLFHPEQLSEANVRPPQLSGIKGCNVVLTNPDGNKLHGWYFKQPGAKFTVLFNHGNGGNVSARQDTVSLLVAAGTSVFIYDYRGFGKSEGVPTIEGALDDVCTAYDFLTKTERLPPEQIVVYGESLGVAFSAYLGSVRPCAGLILQSGFVSLRKIAMRVLPVLSVYPPLLFPRQSLDTLAILKGKHPPLLMIHGCEDTVVPFAHAEELYAAASQPKTLLTLPSCGHSDIASNVPREFERAVRSFLDRLEHTKLPSKTELDTV